MKNWLKRFGASVIALRNKLVGGDLFATARFRIIFWYTIIGLVILLVAGVLVYSYLISTIEHIVATIQELLLAPGAVSEQATSQAITQSINTELSKMSVVVGIWIIFTMVLSAYVLAEIVLWPIRRAMERQRRFIADVSHELRTPLSVMRMNSEVALMERVPERLPAGRERRRGELTETIQNNIEEIDRMSKITQFLLDFSDPERHRKTYERIPVDIGKATEVTVKSMTLLAEQKGVTLQFASDDGPLVVLGNTTALGEMLTNLIKNAITYTPQGGVISVRITRTGRRWGDSITVTVTDTGVGIPPEDLPNIFEPFYRAKNAQKEKHSVNTGLGLAIVKEITELHGATITAKSELGHGTAISVIFPSFSRKLHPA